MTLSQITSIAHKKFLRYPRPNVHEALELRFAERSLKGGTGYNVGPDDVEAVLISHLRPFYVLSLHRGSFYF